MCWCVCFLPGRTCERLQKTLSILNSITYSWVVDERPSQRPSSERAVRTVALAAVACGSSSLNFMFSFCFYFINLCLFFFLRFVLFSFLLFLKKEKQLKTLIIFFSFVLLLLFIASTTHLSKMVVRVTITKLNAKRAARWASGAGSRATPLLISMCMCVCVCECVVY